MKWLIEASQDCGWRFSWISINKCVATFGAKHSLFPKRSALWQETLQGLSPCEVLKLLLSRKKVICCTQIQFSSRRLKTHDEDFWNTSDRGRRHELARSMPRLQGWPNGNRRVLHGARQSLGRSRNEKHLTWDFGTAGLLRLTMADQHREPAFVHQLLRESSQPNTHTRWFFRLPDQQEK